MFHLIVTITVVGVILVGLLAWLWLVMQVLMIKINEDENDVAE